MAMPGFHGKGKQRCGARVKSRIAGRCRRWPVKLFGRCHLHGGLSTGPRTEAGKAKVIRAMVEGRRNWLARLKAEGQKVPCGPKAKKPLTKLREEVAEGLKRNDEEFTFKPRRSRRCASGMTEQEALAKKKARRLLWAWKKSGYDYRVIEMAQHGATGNTEW